MADSAQPGGSEAALGSERGESSMPSRESAVAQLTRWGGVAGVAGFFALLASVVVVVSLDLPDASEVETLTDFADIKSGRVAEHFFYLGALVLFALHGFVLYRVLRTAHLAAALFGTIVAGFGLVIMAASSLLHVSTAPLSELYTAPDASPEDLRAIEYAWHAAQSVFDTMLATGVLLVPIGIVLFGLAMWKAPAFGGGLTLVATGLGIVGTIGAVIAVADPGSMFSAASVLAIAVFYLASGWRLLRLGTATVTASS